MAQRPLNEIRRELYAVAEDASGDVARGALWIAAEKYPSLDPEKYMAYLHGIAQRISSAIAPDAEPSHWRRAIGDALFEREGFAGNGDNYYDPRNSYLNDVIDRKTGIPITLSVIYLSVARKLGRDAVGLNVPGHFLLRLDGEVVDPFNSGRVVEHEALVAQLQRAQAPNPEAQLQELYRNPATTRSILTRMLVNLRSNHLRENRLDQALSAVDRLVHLDPENHLWLRQRGALFQALDCPGAAVKDLEDYLERAPNDPEADVIRSAVEQLRDNLPSLQ